MDAPRRGRRPRRPASFLFHASGGDIPHPDGRTRRGRRPRRPASFFFHAYGGDISRSGATSFCPRRQKDAKTPPKTHGLWNSFRPLAITAQKGPTTNRLYFYPRCRSRVPRENFLLSRRTGEVLYILHNFVSCGPKGRTYLSQPAEKRHPLPRPAFERPQWAHPAHTYLAMSQVAHPVGAGVPDGPHRFSFMPTAGIFRAPARHPFAHGGKRVQKRRQKPTVFGFPFRPIVTAVQKGSARNCLRVYPRCRSRVPRKSTSS